MGLGRSRVSAWELRLGRLTPTEVRATLPRMSVYLLPARDADVAAVFVRRPSRWWRVLRWDLATGAIEAGAAFAGTLYPRRCDLSPDGRFLTYLALQAGKEPFCGMTGVKTWIGLSRLPWLTTLAAWATAGTWSRGLHFVAGSGSDVSAPDHGDDRPLRGVHLGLAPTRPEQYASERRRGWGEHERCPARAPDDVWDERRSVVLTRTRPGGTERLVLTDTGWDARGAGRIEGRQPRFRLDGGEVTDDVVQADWDRRGRLLVVTREGRLQVRHGPGLAEIAVERDLSTLRMPRRPAPEWARRW